MAESKVDAPAKGKSKKSEKPKPGKPESRRTAYVAKMYEESKTRFKEVFGSCKEKAKAMKAVGGDIVRSDS